MILLAKIFLGTESFYALGPGRVALLRATSNLGSLHKAAQSLGMSYRWAWGRLKDSEKALGISLLAAGPNPGRGQPKVLSPEGQALLDWYTELEETIQKTLDQIPRPNFLPSTVLISEDISLNSRTSLD
jgi:molybdate transport system regulatory protein